ncbi:MAG: dTDP-glucose 4,6-dehydratase [Myxococcota bacterium]|nr:dTDP-glucose 4,6-dehydratase [Myxococcota bacterium]
MTRRILLTGGCGFIGTNFVRFLLDQEGEDLQVTNLDLLTYAGNRQSLEDIEDDPRYRFVQGDIADGRLVDSLFAEGVDEVVNMAAESHVDRSIDNPGIFIRTNILGTQVLLEAARRHGVRRFLQVSTDEVYGSLGPTGYFTESSHLDPSSPYSSSKAGADLLVVAYHHTCGLPINITRCSNNSGPYQFPEKLIPLMIAKARADEPLPVYGDGLNVRDWLHVDDHCAALWAVLQRAEPGAIYNVGGHNEITNLDLVKQLLSILGKPESLISFVTDRPGHDRRYAIDPARIEADLDWTPKNNPSDGLRRTVDWYLANEAWWQPLLEQAKLEHR